MAAEKRTEFARSFNAKQVAPAWLFEAPRPVAKTGVDHPTPAPLDEKQREAFEEVSELLDGGKVDSARDALGAGSAQELPPHPRNWLEARLAFHQKKWDEADRALAPLLEAGFASARVLAIRVMIGRGKVADAVRATDKLLADLPEQLDGLQGLCGDLFDAGRIGAARRVLERARSLGLRGNDVRELLRMLRYADNGPDWPRRYEVKRTNYHVFSDIDQAMCAKAAGILEKAYQAFNAYIGDVKDAGKRQRFKVYVFSGEAEYQRYLKDLTGRPAPGSAGCYFPKLKHLLIWNTDETQMLYTIRHEGFHQYFDRVVMTPPLWLNEGLAEYYEQAKSGTWQKGTSRKDHIALLKQRGVYDLKGFIHMDPQQFYADISKSYAQSWAVVRFLRHSSPENRKLFKRLIETMKTKPGKEAMAEVFEDVNWTALEIEFKAHLTELTYAN